MKGTTNAPKNSPDKINLSEKEKQALKSLIQEKIQNIDPTNSMSVWAFFNHLELYPLPHLPYSMENVSVWNSLIISHKTYCIEQLRSNSNKMPQVYLDKFNEFLQILITIGVIDQATECIENIEGRIVRALLQSNNPTK